MVGLDGDRRIPTQLPKDIDNRTYQFKRNDKHSIDKSPLCTSSLRYSKQITFQLHQLIPAVPNLKPELNRRKAHRHHITKRLNKLRQLIYDSNMLPSHETPKKKNSTLFMYAICIEIKIHLTFLYTDKSLLVNENPITRQHFL